MKTRLGLFLQILTFSVGICVCSIQSPDFGWLRNKKTSGPHCII